MFDRLCRVVIRLSAGTVILECFPSLWRVSGVEYRRIPMGITDNICMRLDVPATQPVVAIVGEYSHRGSSCRVTPCHRGLHRGNSRTVSTVSHSSQPVNVPSTTNCIISSFSDAAMIGLFGAPFRPSSVYSSVFFKFFLRFLQSYFRHRKFSYFYYWSSIFVCIPEFSFRFFRSVPKSRLFISF